MIKANTDKPIRFGIRNKYYSIVRKYLSQLSAGSAQMKSQDARAQEWKFVNTYNNNENYVRCQSLLLCKHCLGLLIPVPSMHMTSK